MACRVFIADDEPLICNELRYILEQEPDVEIVGECYSGKNAVDKILQARPQVVFLDINMPGRNGLEIARDLLEEKYAPFVVFSTAYEEYALDAFKVNAVDYILKPFTSLDIKNVLNKVKERLDSRVQYMQKINQSLEQLQNTGFKRIQGEKSGKIHLIDPEDVNYIQIINKTCYIITTECEYTTNMTMSNLEMKLSEKYYFRCHRNYLVNLKKIREIIPWFNGTYLLVLNNKEKTEIPVSKYRVKDFKAMVGL